MLVDPSEVQPTKVYQYLISCIVPRPIAWVSTISPEGVPNLAPFSYFTGVGLRPAAVCFSPQNRRDGSKKDTVINLASTPQFVVNVVPASLGEAMNLTSAEYGYEENEFEKANLAMTPSQRVKPPSVADSPVKLECELIQIVEIGQGPLAANLVIGKILVMNINEAVLDAQGEIDPRKLDLIGRMGRSDMYVRTTDLFSMPRPSVEKR